MFKKLLATCAAGIAAVAAVLPAGAMIGPWWTWGAFGPWWPFFNPFWGGCGFPFWGPWWGPFWGGCW